MRSSINDSIRSSDSMGQVHPSKRPIAIALFILLALLLSVVVDGSFIRFLQIRQEIVRVTDSIKMLKEQSAELTERISQAQRPEYIERQAVELFDVSQEDEIIFTFAGQNAQNR